MPDAPVVLYDGSCDICRDWSRRLAGWDDAGRIRQVAYQERGAVAGLPVIADAELDRALHVVLPDGQVARGARAIIAVLPWLPGGRLLAWLARLPGVAVVAERVYDAVARRRHRLGAADRSCDLR